VVLSPGSRCAPLTLAFTRHPQITTKVVPDERSAAFIALGLAQQTRQPVVLVCTSGSAAYNYAPAVAEAYFQQIPLIIFTADRPPEWIDQYDGQTIRQTNIYGNHIKKSFDLPVDHSHPDAVWHSHRSISEAINISSAYPCGPVHINVPLREPLYPEAGTTIHYSLDIKVFDSLPHYTAIPQESWKTIFQSWTQYHKVLIVGGQNPMEKRLITMLNELGRSKNIPIVADVISNLHGVEQGITMQDAFLRADSGHNLEALKPELLITFGKSVISKNLKKFLRKHRPLQHWHIQPSGHVADTFQALTRVIPADPDQFFSYLVNHFFPAKNENWHELWLDTNKHTLKSAEACLKKAAFGEFRVVHHIMRNLPENTHLHLANSMAVRYANFVGLHNRQHQIEVFANRGTSGIDGSNSTALGHALATDQPVVLITGDIAFFYDRNAFWHNNLPGNLRIILLNNHAGGIFRLIQGPANQPELEQYFETSHALNARSCAKEFGLDYALCQNLEDLERLMPNFFEESPKPKIMEIETDSPTSKTVYDQFIKAVTKT